MSARRAMPNELIEPTVVSADVARRAAACARRAQADAVQVTVPAAARRAMPESYAARRAVDAPATMSCARRAIVDVVDTPKTGSAARALVEEDAPTLIAPPAFAAKDTKKILDPRKLLAATGVLAAIGATTGALLSGPSVVMAATQPTAAETVADATIDPVSQDAVATAAELNRQAELVSRDSARRALSEWEEAEAAEAEQQKIEEIKAYDPSQNFAPGQLTPFTVEQAMARAASLVGNHGYEQMCLKLSADIYGYSSSGTASAIIAARAIEAAGQMHTDMENIPVGALVWYDGAPIGNPYGHVAVYAGDGMIYSNGASTGVGKMSINEPATGWGQPIIGWSGVWLPAATK